MHDQGGDSTSVSWAPQARCRGYQRGEKHQSTGRAGAAATILPAHGVSSDRKLQAARTTLTDTRSWGGGSRTLQAASGKKGQKRGAV